MSQVRVSGNVSGTGVFTVASPNSNNNQTATLPDATGNVVLDSATQSLTNKSFDSASVPTVSGTAPLYMARAWVNFNGTGTVAIRASGNVSSITDNATGNYRVNFTNAMPDANYAINVTNGSTSTDSLWPVIYIPNTSNGGAPTTTSCGVNCGFVSGSSQGDLDPVRVNVAIFR